MSRSGDHYMPRPDGDFAAWAEQYYDALQAWWAAAGQDPAGLDALTAAVAGWRVAYPAHVAARAAAEGATRAKDAARAALEGAARPLTNFIQSSPATTDADRATMGIAVRRTGGPPAPAPTGRPRATVEIPARLTHRLRIADESTPTRRARPRGVLGAELWVALSAPASGATPHAPPASPPMEAYRFLTIATRGGLTTTFPAADGGKTAHYQLRWLSARGERGPWSEVATATVAA